MKIVAISLALLLPFIAAPAASTPREFRNPILFADYSDPDVIRVGNAYYMAASSFSLSPGLPVLKSSDLVHWQIIGHVLPRLTMGAQYDLPGPTILHDGWDYPAVRTNAHRTGHRYGGGVWAPALRYHDGQFKVYFATPHEGVFMASAKDPAGPWTAPVTMIEQAGLEDPCPFWDDDGQAYLIHSKVGAGPLVLHRMSSDGKSVLDEGKVIIEDKLKLPVLEGPKLYKRNGWYYIFAPIGGVETGPQVVFRARDIWGPYEHRIVLEQGSTKVQAPHQGAWVETPSGQGWFLHFNSTGAFGRIVHMQPVSWVDDWPVMGKPIDGKQSGEPVMRHAMPDTGQGAAPVRIQDSDEFARAELGLQWEWNHNPVDANWSLRERKGFMRLRAMPSKHLITARNTLTQIQQGDASELTTRVDLGGMAHGQKAGLGMLSLQPSMIGVRRQDGVNRLFHSAAGVQTDGPAIAGKSIEFKLMTRPDQTVSYYYSTDNGKSFAALGGPAKMRFSFWKGARPALFSYNTEGSEHGCGPAGCGYADIDWVRVKVHSPNTDSSF